MQGEFAAATQPVIQASLGKDGQNTVITSEL